MSISPTLMTLGPALLPAIDVEGGRRSLSQPSHHSGRASSPTFMPSGWLASNPYIYGTSTTYLHSIYPGVSTDQDPTIVPGGITDYSHHGVPHPPPSSPASLHCAHILLFLFLFHFPTIYLLVLVVPGISKWGLRSGLYALLMYYDNRQGSFSSRSTPQGLCNT